MKLTDTKDIRALNRLLILQTIHKSAPVSRADIAVITKLNKATVSTIVKELLELKLIAETSIGDSTGGRKPIMLTPLHANGYTIALDLNITHINIIITTLDTQICSRHHFDLEGTDFETNFSKLCSFLNELITQLHQTPYGVVGIGVSVRGVVDLEGIVRYVHVLNWIDIDLKHLLEEAFNIPVFIDNEGNFSAMAESLHYPHIQDLSVITIDDVISAGILCNRQLVRGFRGYANTFAHHIIDFDGRSCICGQKGCFETYISHRALLKEVNESISIPDIDTLITFAQNKHPIVTELLERFVIHLAAGLTNLIYIVDSELIIINSRILSALPELLEAAQQHIILPITKSQTILPSKIGEVAPLLGAAKLASDMFYESILIF
ncbi:MAG: ROK family transcriptional regulator [Cellulosilyticaceae bacterium]